MTVHASKNYVRRAEGPGDPRVALLKQLADPIRLRVIDRLGHAGPATVSRLAGELTVPLPQLSNHLRRLREAGLITGQRSGRQITYELADPGLELLAPLLDSITGRMSAGRDPAVPEVPSRTCYDHLAGATGVRLYRALVKSGALVSQANGIVTLGPNAHEVLRALGVDPTLTPAGRQRFAFECLDATERTPHLAGALGDALAESFMRRRWIRRRPGSREYTVTPAGRRQLQTTLGFQEPARPRGAASR
ncbi:MAG: metalloregulator ArsR/SmtB family transcription factor [Solirubrobacteraceae bacterium]